VRADSPDSPSPAGAAAPTPQPDNESVPATGRTLRCPYCDYDLTGLPRNRCPECGKPFNPRELYRLASGTPQLLPGTTGAPLADAVRIATQVFLRPREFARHFPATHHTGQAIGYSCLCYVAALVLYTGLGAALANARDLLVIPLIAVGALVGFTLCETLIAAALAGLLKPYGIRRRYHFWRGLTHSAGGYTLLTALWGGTVPWIVDSGPGYTELSMLVTGLAVPVFIWRALTLGRMVALRSRPRARLRLGLLLIPVIGFGSILAGIAASVFVGMSCLRPW